MTKVREYTVQPIYDDEKMTKKINTFLKPSDIKQIINHDADVYIETVDPQTNEKSRILLLKFRKNVLSKEKCDAFYENIIQFANQASNNRTNSNGVKDRKNWHYSELPKVKTNIFGYFDEFGPQIKKKFKDRHFHPSIAVRPCSFNAKNPEKYACCVPLVQEIDALYRKHIPDPYAKQIKAAEQIGEFRIPHTSFTTVTTNLNYQTTIHRDRGDFEEGFGNLAVLQRGEYDGGETCFPRFGLGVDVREGDVLFMNVHEPHANLPLVMKSPDAIRLSIVCYLRGNILKNIHGKTAKQKRTWNQKIRRFMGYPTHGKTLKCSRRKESSSD